MYQMITYYHRIAGDLMDEEDVLDFLTSPDNMESSDAIEKVNKRMLERVLTRCDYLAVFFCKFIPLKKKFKCSIFSNSYLVSCYSKVTDLYFKM